MNNEASGRWVVRLLSALVFVNGILALFRPLVERFPEHLENSLILANYEQLTRSIDIFLGITLIYLSYQLLQRRILAWWLSLISAFLLASLHLGSSRLLFATAAPVITIVLLLFGKRYFKAKSNVRPIRNGLLILMASLTLALVYGTAGFWLMDKRDFGVNFTITGSVTESLRAYSPFNNTGLYPHTRHAQWFLDSISIMGAFAVMYGLYSLFRPIEYTLLSAPVERARAEKLLENYSHSSEDFFKLWPHDKSYFFSSDGQAFIAYGVKAGIALVVEDPVGPLTSVKQVIKEFNHYCLTQGWNPAYIYVSNQYSSSYESGNLNMLKIGEDAIIDLKKFRDQTSRNKHFRNILNRFQKAGYTTSFHQPPHNKQLLNQLALISKDWAAQPDRKEWSFLAGSFSERYMQMSRLFVVYDNSGTAQAFVNLIPTYTDGFATIDLMRHRSNALPNIMDYLFSELFLHLEDSYKYFNLGLAPLSGLNQTKGRPEERLLHLIYRANQRFISFQGLRQFKNKFEPEWEPKYIAYKGSPAKMPRIAYSLAKMMG